MREFTLCVMEITTKVISIPKQNYFVIRTFLKLFVSFFSFFFLFVAFGYKVTRARYVPVILIPIDHDILKLVNFSRMRFSISTLSFLFTCLRDEINGPFTSTCICPLEITFLDLFTPMLAHFKATIHYQKLTFITLLASTYETLPFRVYFIETMLDPIN